MQYQIIGQTVPAVEIKMNAGESVYTQSGGMIWQTPGIEMNTNARGGLGKSIGRLFAGESLFMVNYTAKADNVSITFGSTVPGSVVPVNVGEVPMICQKGAFLCAEQSVQLNVTFTKRFSAGMFGGEGLFLTRLTGPGTIMLQTQSFDEFTRKISSRLPTKG